MASEPRKEIVHERLFMKDRNPAVGTELAQANEIASRGRPLDNSRRLVFSSCSRKANRSPCQKASEGARLNQFVTLRQQAGLTTAQFTRYIEQTPQRRSAGEAPPRQAVLDLFGASNPVVSGNDKAARSPSSTFSLALADFAGASRPSAANASSLANGTGTARRPTARIFPATSTRSPATSAL